MAEMKNIFIPIGIYKSKKENPYEAARQSSNKSKNLGEINLNSGKNFEQALQGLDSFNYIWIIYEFHHNQNWKPMVSPPRTLPRGPKKIGVFATRSPYRPNPIGMSCVRLISINKLKLIVEGADLLNNTPILDIKPYLVYADSIPKAKMGWLKNIEKYKFQISFSKIADNQINFLDRYGVSQIRDFIHIQLEYEPKNNKKKRIVRLKNSNELVIAYRTWRIQYRIQNKKILIQKIFSGYSTNELHNSSDPFQDKYIHIEFNKKY